MARLIDEEIKGKLVDELLFGALEKGGHVAVDVGDDDKLRFTVQGQQRRRGRRGSLRLARRGWLRPNDQLDGRVFVDPLASLAEASRV
jgi:hypothetical protein